MLAGIFDDDSFAAAVAVSCAVALVAPLITMFMMMQRRKKEDGIEGDEKKEKTLDKVLMSVLENRRSIFPKDFVENPDGEQIPRRHLELMLEAANWAPTHGRTEPWEFRVLGRASIERILDLKRAHAEKTGADESVFKKLKKKRRVILQNCKNWIAICLKRKLNRKGKLMPEWEEVAAVSMAVQNMHLMASVLGVAGYWTSGGTGEDGYLASNDVKSFLQIGGSDDLGDKCLGFFVLGHQNDKSKYKGRREDVAKSVRWMD